MTTHHKHSSDAALSLVDAVGTLSNIADLEFDRQIGVTQEHDLEILDDKATYHTVHWLHKDDAESTVSLVRETFKVILKYLRNFYKREYTYVTDQSTLERIKTIMVLVGEAARKLDKYTSLFKETQQQSIMQTKEYKDLQEFYLRKISRTIDEGVLGQWILALSKRSAHKRPSSLRLTGERKSPEATRVFVDLESVKKDTEYELFYLRKEDGTRFFNPRLIRNIKLVCDFGAYFGQTKEEDPLLDIHIWQDRYYYNAAKKMVKSLKPTLDRFYQEVAKYRDNPLVAKVTYAIMALMMAGNAAHLWNHTPKKYCRNYFYDFQHYIRESLQMREYQKLIAYPPKENDRVPQILLKTIHQICQELFLNLPSFQAIASSIKHLMIESAAEGSQALPTEVNGDSISARMAKDYNSMLRLIRRHPNGPLNKVLEVIEDSGYQAYDSLLQDNIPQAAYDIKTPENTVRVLRLPCPTHQESIHKAKVTEEFKGFLRSIKDSTVDKHLLINLQDRSSWREFFRSQALEELQNIDEFADVVSISTLAFDSDFYHQLSPYHEDNKFEVFKAHLLQQVKDEMCGFYFPQRLHKKIPLSWFEHAINSIHKIFFSGKNVLSRERRLDFIEIFYLFLELKLLEVLKPTSISFTCKDSIDTGIVNTVALYAFIKIINGQSFSEEEIDSLNTLIYAPAMMVRERLLLPERFNRMVSAIRLIESIRDEMGSVEFPQAIEDTFGPLYETPIIHAQPKLAA